MENKNLLTLFQNDPYTQALLGNSNQKLQLLEINTEALCVASAFQLSQTSLLIVKKNLFQAQRFYSQITQLLQEEDVIYYAVDESLRVEAVASSPEMSVTRNESLAKLLYDTSHKKVIITHTTALLRYLPSPTTYKDKTLYIKCGECYSMDTLKEKLYNAGYQYTAKVDQPMTFAMRGGIIDVFALNHEHPLRIEFFDEEIESIRYFDTISQRTKQIVQEAVITPANEIMFTQEEVESITKQTTIMLEKLSNKDSEEKQILRSTVESEMDLLRNGYSEPSLYKYYSLLDQTYSLLDYCTDSIKILSSFDEIQSSYKQLFEETLVYMQELYEENKSLLILKQYHALEDIIYQYNMIQIDTFAKKDTYVPSSFLPLTLQAATFPSMMDLLIEKSSKYKVVLALPNESDRKQVRNYVLDNTTLPLWKEEDLLQRDTGLFVLEYTFEEGFEAITEKVLVVTSKELFQKKPRIARYANKFKEADVIKHYQELHHGDYVVHEQYGIGQYLGIITKEIDGIHKDFLQVAYKGNDVLLVPLEQFSLVRKFTGKEGAVPKIHKLGSNEWEKTKKRIQEKVNDLAERLVKLYALREEQIGFAFSKDTVMQQEFEEDFDYVLTNDQQNAVNEIKRDMESSKPMERLLCGDVGFGKTEVAIRAAFKAVVDHKQVAFLCPTTILSRQHYETFKKRFEKYPITVALVNRFVEPKKQKEIIQRLRNHEIDILIGTHRMLSQDFIFNDLGLLVIDEEQRFGVEHKEKIKELKNGIDVLSLSATPIPRTMQMSLVGIRSLSQLDTPPKNRMPIQTYVIEKNDSIIKEVIERELARDGQVFYLYNRVSRIYEVARKIEKDIPGSRVGVAHGKMSREEIEEVMEKFMNNEFSILVCTTIIETGIDIPNANTILIEDADHFGLSQLYQIKGRVGRSDRLAYAYLLYTPEKVLNETAMKRLQSIKDFTQLGSGYKIAMRDLAIRGAGDMLGSEQAGFIDTVGMDMYIDMLSHAIKEKKGESEEKEIIAKANIKVDAYLPQKFEQEDLQKITLYQRIDKVSSLSGLKNLQEEVVDRYGKLPKNVTLLFEKKLLEIFMSLQLVDGYKEQGNYLEVTLTSNTTVTLDGLKLFEVMNEISRSIKIKYSSNKITIQIPKGNQMLNQAIHILSMIESGKLNKV
ncbi:MAG: transcription-repair coupling factor [Erysipelotrichales bacterium]|nr:transcription-repair coupling factor [Erysipelotrichales bacterium]